MFKSFQDEILSLIQRKQEGEYWDFKRQWYDRTKPSSLLFDIICLANNTAWRDAFIIIGVDEEQDYKPIDITKDENRRNTQNLVCFLRDKQFASGIRPEVEVRTISLTLETAIDVIVIKATKHTPYYLVHDLEGIKAYHIYSRVKDSNTDRDKSADPHIIEKLWANRFALNTTALEKAKYLLQQPQSWENEPSFEVSYFHSVFPEFTIRYVHDDSRNGYEYYLFSQVNHSPDWYEINLQYHQTVLFSCIGISLDSGACFVPCPEMDFIMMNGAPQYGFCYYIKGTMRYLLYEFFRSMETESWQTAIPRMKFNECVPVFESETEKQDFFKYAVQHIDGYLKKEYKLPHFSSDFECYAEYYRTALMVQDMLSNYRLEFNKLEDEP